MRPFFTLLLLALALLTVDISAQQADPWKSFRSTEGKFSILLPCTPDITSEDIKGSSGSTKQVYHNCRFGDSVYGVSYWTITETATSKVILDKFRDGVASGSKATILDEKEISQSSYAGREFSCEGSAGSLVLHYDWRIFLVGARIYSLSFIMRKGESDPASKQKFFSSFVVEK